MLFNIDKKPKTSFAAIDDAGGHLTYGELVSLREELAAVLSERELVFCLCENRVGALAGFLTLYDCKDVCLLLSAKIDKGLLDSLYETYRPSYFWMPETTKADFGFEIVYNYKGYVIYII